PPGVGPPGTAPPAGSPLPPPAPLSPAAQMGDVSPIAPLDVPSPQTGLPTGTASGAPAGPSVAPSAFGRDALRPGPSGGPSVAIAQYNPHTGSYVAPDGQVYRQSDLVAPTSPKAPKTWKDMFAT